MNLTSIAETKYPINEVFVTIQGEGSFSGHAAIFIRMQGCNVGCAWCDTKHSWVLDSANEVASTQIINKTGDGKNWAWFDLSELLDFIVVNKPKLVVITGGEPLQYNLKELCLGIEASGKFVQIETSGTEIPQISPNTWMTLSPKINMQGGKQICAKAVARANEIKMPIGKMSDIDILLKLIDDYKITVPIWLQPISQNPSATKLCIDQAILRDWRLSVQMHKYLGVR